MYRLSAFILLLFVYVMGLQAQDVILPIGGSKSKLSIHAGWGSNTKDFIENAKPRIVKILDQVDETNIMDKISIY